METLSVATRSRCEMRDITAQVRDLVARGRQQGRRKGEHSVHGIQGPDFGHL